MLSFVAAAAPPTLLALVAASWLERPALVPVFVSLWCLVAYGISRVAFVAARRIFDARRENLAMLA
jgi:hypothetical protein